MAIPAQDSVKSETIWQALTLRLTAFPVLGEPPHDDTWWAATVGQQPDQSTVQPRLGKSEQVGSLGKGILALATEPVRIDWVYGASQQQDDTLPVLGPYLETLDVFLQLMLKWLHLPSVPPIDRIAFGAIIVSPVPDRKTGYEKLKKYIRDVKIDSDNSTDFLYQINRPRSSRVGIPGLRINRLSKWSVLASFLNVFQVSSKQIASASSLTNLACRLEMDINTAPETRLHEHRERLADVFVELVDYSKELHDKGDIP